MRKGETTIARLLKRAGYATCMAGKWHCNSRFNQPVQPQPGDFGFDHWLATQNNARPSHKNPDNYVRNGAEVGPLEGFSCQLVVDEAINWLDQRGNVLEDEPFFLYLAFHEPHEPIASPDDLVAEYQQVARNEQEAQYFANVANVDSAVGRMITALEERNLRDNTLVVFTSDNGPETLHRYRGSERSYGRPAPLRGMKLHTHDAGFRVAGIMSWPGKISGGQVVSTPTSSLDFLPTFCELAQTSVPESLKLDGTSFLPALEGKAIERAKPLFWVYFNAINEARVAMRDGDWKVLARLNGGEFPKLQNVTAERLTSIQEAQLTDFEIYNVRKDIDESDNMVNSDGEQIGELQKKLTHAYRELVSESHVWTPTQTQQ